MGGCASKEKKDKVAADATTGENGKAAGADGATADAAEGCVSLIIRWYFKRGKSAVVYDQRSQQ